MIDDELTEVVPGTPTMRQDAPYPADLADLVAQLAYRPGWQARLEDRDRGQGSRGLTLVITTVGFDSYHPDRGQTYRVAHYMIVPAASYNRESWQRWLFEQYLLVEQHEAMEFFAIDGNRPYAPNHGPGNDPYTIRELTDDEARRTSSGGALNPPASDTRPHSRACGIRCPGHGVGCAPDCPTCGTLMATSPAEPLRLRLCDDKGWVSELRMPRGSAGMAADPTLTYLRQLNNLRSTGGHGPWTGGAFRCSGSAHLGGTAIVCTSPVHQSGALMAGAPVNLASPPTRFAPASEPPVRLG